MFKVLKINLITLFVLLLILEIFGRIYLSYRDSSNYFQSFKVRELTKYTPIGLTQYDDSLGYIMSEGFDGVVTTAQKHWNNKQVRILKDGVRSNDNLERYDSDILAVGDSFTFGDQVSNSETWPSCLERKTKRGVLNAGIPGYGGAQSVKRAKLLSEKYSFNELIVSFYIEDFSRDQNIFNNGFPTPAVIKDKNGKIGWAQVPSKNTIGSRYQPESDDNFLQFFLSLFYENSVLGRPIIIDFLNLDKDLSGIYLTKRHNNAVFTEEVIRFAIQELSKINIPKKTILIQYASNYDNPHKFEYLRNPIKKFARKFDIPVLDSYEELSMMKFKKEEIWNSHHTKLGNELICKYIYKNIKN